MAMRVALAVAVLVALASCVAGQQTFSIDPVQGNDATCSPACATLEAAVARQTQVATFYLAAPAVHMLRTSLMFAYKSEVVGMVDPMTNPTAAAVVNCSSTVSSSGGLWQSTAANITLRNLVLTECPPATPLLVAVDAEVMVDRCRVQRMQSTVVSTLRGRLVVRSSVWESNSAVYGHLRARENRVLIQNSTFVANTGIGVNASGTWDVTVSDSVFIGSARAPLFVPDFGHVLVERCSFLAGRGTAAVMLSGDSVTVVDSLFADNTATAASTNAALTAQGPRLTLQRTVFERNTAHPVLSNMAQLKMGTPTPIPTGDLGFVLVEGCTFRSNGGSSAALVITHTASIAAYDAAILIVDSIFEDNHSELNIGALDVQGYNGQPLPRLRIRTTRFDRNTGYRCGAFHVMYVKDALLDRVAVVNNTAVKGDIGAVWLEVVTKFYTTTTGVTTFQGNRASTHTGCILVDSCGEVYLEGVIARGNMALDGHSGFVHAASAAYLVLTNSLITDNYATQFAGAVSCMGTTIQMSGTSMERNSVSLTSGFTEGGGGIFGSQCDFWDQMNNRFINNTAWSGGAVSLVAFSTWSSITLPATRMVLEGNVALGGNGGALAMERTYMSCYGHFRNNRAPLGNGGGVWVRRPLQRDRGTASSLPEVTFVNCSALNGGAAAFEGLSESEQFSVGTSSSLVTGCSAQASGGGFYWIGTAPILNLGVTIAKDNTARHGPRLASDAKRLVVTNNTQVIELRPGSFLPPIAVHLEDALNQVRLSTLHPSRLVDSCLLVVQTMKADDLTVVEVSLRSVTGEAFLIGGTKDLRGGNASIDTVIFLATNPPSEYRLNVTTLPLGPNSLKGNQTILIRSVPCLPGTYLAEYACLECPLETYALDHGMRRCLRMPEVFTFDESQYVVNRDIWVGLAPATPGQPTEIAAYPCPRGNSCGSPHMLTVGMVGFCDGGAYFRLGYTKCATNRVQSASNVLCGQCAPGHADFAGSCIGALTRSSLSHAS